MPMPAGVEFASHSLQGPGGSVRLFVTVAANRRIVVRSVNTLGRDAVAVIRTATDTELAFTVPPGNATRTGGLRQYDTIAHFELRST